jgi:hypothetical protein
MPVATMMLPLVLAATVNGDAAGLTDPTRPVDYLPAAAAAPLPEAMTDWKLTAVRIGAADRSAVLNGKVVRTGDVLGRARITEIRPGAVLVEYDRREVEVRLNGMSVKKKSAEAASEAVRK